MALSGTRTLVGFGFGPIQAGLFLVEAFRSNAFARLVVAEVEPQIVDALRRAGGMVAVNIAHGHGIEQVVIGPVEIENPGERQDAERLVQAIAQADELSTAVPSVDAYVTASAGSVHRLLAAGLRRKVAQGGPPAVLYAAENFPAAARILQTHVLREAGEDGPAIRQQVQFVDTVIGKMSGAALGRPELATVTPYSEQAFLVEAFNQILIAAIDLPGSGFRRGIAVFEEKQDLVPFEETKLYAHNAVHATAAYLAALLGEELMSGLRRWPEAMTLLRSALVEEAGAALVHKYDGLDPLFTPLGFARYADDLLARMTNPYLMDTVARVARDPARKLGWQDRLIGAIRLALSQGVQPLRLAAGAAAALEALRPGSSPAAELPLLWRASAPASDERRRVLDWVEAGRQALQAWRASHFRDWSLFVRHPSLAGNH